MKKFSFLFLIIFLFVCNFAFADVWQNKTDIETIISQIPDIGSIKCKFRQEKILPNIEQKIVSSGNFEFVKNEGVYFYTTYPIQSTVNYTNKNYKQINDIINAISQKKYKKLQKEFDFYFEGNSKNWIIGLMPNGNPKTAEFLSNITIKGSDYIKEIKIEMVNGNTTTLWFEK